MFVAGPYGTAPHWVCFVAWDDVPVEMGLCVSEELVVHLVRGKGGG